MEEEKESKETHLLNNHTYDVLKNVALVVLPALGALYGSLALLWGLPAADSVIGTIVAVDTFLGVVIKLGDKSYNASEARFDGDMIVQKKAGELVGYNLALKGDPEKLQDKEQVTFKVKSE